MLALIVRQNAVLAAVQAPICEVDAVRERSSPRRRPYEGSVHGLEAQLTHPPIASEYL